MTVQVATRIVCDAPHAADVPGPVPVALTDETGTPRHFCTWACVGDWAAAKGTEAERHAYLAERHRRLHAALDTLPPAQVADRRGQVSGKVAWQESRGRIVEDHSADEVDAILAELRQ